uniref:DNA 3'-5' helicase n=1 Tax=Crassostrea virginica TaxID=6565 RepID=A0A8B8B6F7_CRAVI|nr:ATP-dependent DNA helicase Q-like 3 [Crassostrea virginica]
MSEFEDVMKKAVTFYGDIKLKKEQLEVLEAVYEGRDCVAVLPTGFGKSVIFHLIPYLTPQPKTVIVVAPITALMEDQLQSLSEKEISACSISMDGTFYNTVSQEDGCIKTVSMNHFDIADFRLVYAHPETVTTNSRIRKLLLTKRFQEIVCCIVIDEVHMVSEWGDSFRPSFSKLGELTAIFTRIPQLALTATATPKCVEQLCEILQLRNVKLVFSNPDRPNIYYEVKTRLPNIKKMMI